MAHPISARPSLAVVWPFAAASALVLAFGTVASFRFGLGSDLPTLLAVNAGRVLMGAGAGAAFGLAGALRGSQRAVREVALLVAVCLGVAFGLLAAGERPGAAGVAIFVAVGLAVGGLAFGAVQALDRPRRWTNLALAGALLLTIGATVYVDAVIRTRGDLVTTLGQWLTGDLTRARPLPAATLLLAVSALGYLATRPRSPAPGTLAAALGFGVAGPQALVGLFAAGLVRRLAPGASRSAHLVASAMVGAAALVAMDTLSRLSLGGYAIPLALLTAAFAIPLYLPWNRARLARVAKPTGRAFTILEWVTIAVLSAGLWYHLALFAGIISRLT